MTNRSIILNSVNYFFDNGRDFSIVDLNLSIPENSITCILGKNGIGKTTLLLLILGYLKPRSGKVNLLKSKSSIENEDTYQKISYLPQNEELPMNLSITEYILLGRLPFISPLSIPDKMDIESVLKYVKLLEIDNLRSAKLGAISGGELQRVRLCRALVQESRLILLDEPVTHLDISSKYAIMKMIKNLKNIGKTIIFTSHDPIEALQISDNSLLMYEDKHVIFGPTKEILNSENISSCLDIAIKIIENCSGFTYQVQGEL